MKTEIFSYNTLKVHLQKETKTLFLQLVQPTPSKINLINEATIVELESLFSWVSQHIEIHSIVINGQSNYFSKGFEGGNLLLYKNNNQNGPPGGRLN